MPPALWNAAKALKAPKTYPSWESAAKAAGQYADLPVNEFRAARRALNLARGFVPDMTGSPLLAVLGLATGPISVTDIGGATGEVGAALVARFPGLAYTVVENPTLVGLMSADGPVRFVTQIPDRCDVFYSSGTIHYLENPYEAMKISFSSASKAVILVRNSFAEREIYTVDRPRLHENGSGLIPEGFLDREITYPRRTVSEARVQDLAREAGFTLAYRNTGNEPPSVPGAYDAQLVFLKP